MRAGLPPAGCVVERRDFIESQLFIVIRAYPFSRIDGAFLQRGVNVAPGNLLRHDTQLLHDAPSKTTDSHFQTMHVLRGFDLATEPAAHLAAGVATHEVNNAVLGKKITHQLPTTALIHPSGLLTSGQTKRHRRIKSESRVLAEVVVRRRVTHLHRARLNCIHYLQRRYQLTAGKHADIEFAVGQRRYALGHNLSRAEDGVE